MKHGYAVLYLLALVISLESRSQCFEEKNGLVAFEAEDFFEQTKDNIRKWYVIGGGGSTPQPDPDNHEGASGGKYIELLPDTRVIGHSGPGPEDPLIRGENFSDNAGEMAIVKYKIHFNNPGKYFVWVRANSSGPEDNGVHVGIDGTWPASGERMQWCLSKNRWHWESKQRTSSNHCGDPRTSFINVPSAGVHTIEFSMREDGFEMDKVVLSKAYTKPDGTGPSVRTIACDDNDNSSCTIPTDVNNTRIAVVADGNSRDPDDIGGTAVTLAIMRAMGAEQDLVYYAHSCDLVPTNIPPAKELERQELMQTSCDGTALRWGGFGHVTFYNVRTQQTLSTNKLRDAINAATSARQLTIILAGEPDIVYDAVKAANANKRKFVTIVTHHIANDESADDPNKNISDLEEDYPEVTIDRIPDQNTKLQTPLSAWHWARDHEDSRVRWLWRQGEIGEEVADGVANFQNGKFDCSDAGMMYYQLVGKELPTVGDLHSLFNCYVSDNDNSGGNQSPLVSFTLPGTTTLSEGYSPFLVNVAASDPDGTIASVLLKLNGSNVRTEINAPYDWNHKDLDADKVLNDLPAGTHTLTAIATDNEGATTSKNLVLTVLEEGLTLLSPIHDAYVQDGTGKNDQDLRVEAGRRKTYLQFDISSLPEGMIREAELILAVGSDQGNGTLSLYQARHSSWTEGAINGSNAPGKSGLLDELFGSFALNSTHTFDVSDASMEGNKISFVIEMDAGGNDVSFASKENTDFPAPQLRVKVDAITSHEDKISSTLEVFPNPSANGTFHLSEKVTFSVHDIHGVAIKSGTGSMVNLSEFPPGVYFMSVNHMIMRLMK